ncbi:uncharacterized protein HKW66_Vig0007500 [Vigna angularis]|uniref:Uncharacterized protein n=1 Tax=Phaseolus angularis TaxID=3914 RepID=A0A8T0LI69_PHAAN|nr:uncharacterized protein HKW66_Vig0007500 [Vigna angularis]
MAPRLPPPPQPTEPDASNSARLLETVIDRLQQHNATLMEQNATLMQQNQTAMQSLEASRANAETTQRQLMEILAATRGVNVRDVRSNEREFNKTKAFRKILSPEPFIFYLRNQTIHLLQLLSRNPKLLSTVILTFLLRFLFQHRRNVRPAEIFRLNRTEFDSKLNAVRDEPSFCIRAYTAIQLKQAWSILRFRDTHLHIEGVVMCGNGRGFFVHRLDMGEGLTSNGGAYLEEMLEEENLEDANLVEVEVKAEP